MKSLKAASFLIENGADVNALDLEGFSPLVYAIIGNFKEGVGLLLDNGALVNKKYIRALSALEFALGDKNRVEIVELLIQKVAKFDEVEAYGNRALATAVYNHNDATIKILVKYGLVISKEVEVLKGVIYQPNAFGVELLINNGVSVNERDKDGNTPLAIAINALCYKKSGCDYTMAGEQNVAELRKIIRFLLEKGANPNVGIHDRKFGPYEFYEAEDAWIASCNPLIKNVRNVDRIVYQLLLKFGAEEEVDNAALEAMFNIVF